MEKLLIDNNFRFIGSGCSCSGGGRKYYNVNHPLYKILIFPAKQTFVILKNNVRYADGKADELEQKLKMYGLI